MLKAKYYGEILGTKWNVFQANIHIHQSLLHSLLGKMEVNDSCFNEGCMFNLMDMQRHDRQAIDRLSIDSGRYRYKGYIKMSCGQQSFFLRKKNEDKSISR